MMSKPQSENAVRRGAKTILELRGWFVSIVTNRGVPNKKGVFFFQGSKGLPDILAIRHGVVLAVECKTKRGQLRDSQKAWRDQWVAHGGEYIVYREPRDLPL